MPTTTSARIVVAGATGRLGRIVDALLARGHRVVALCREPNSAGAARLQALGAEVVRGDFDDPSGIEHAANGADALFATGTAHRTGPDGELRHGIALARAAALAGVGHLVYVSGDGAAPDSPLSLFRAKYAVEEQIRALTIPATILAPVYFMENLFNPWNLGALRAGTFPSPIEVEARLQQVAVADLIALAVLAIERRSMFAGRRVTVASDEVSALEAAGAFSALAGVSLPARRLDGADLPPPLRALFAWLEETGHNADIAELRRQYPEVGWHDYRAWAKSQAQRLKRTVG
jgi:uncharacterized protein YbjT (DUF2867 family)